MTEGWKKTDLIIGIIAWIFVLGCIGFLIHAWK